jgi:hypothetical protein
MMIVMNVAGIIAKATGQNTSAKNTIPAQNGV